MENRRRSHGSALLAAGAKAGGSHRERIDKETTQTAHEILDSDRKRSTMIRSRPDGKPRFDQRAPTCYPRAAVPISTSAPRVRPITDKDRQNIPAANTRSRSKLRVLGSALS